ncbi:hypothetical protein JLK41_19055 [Ectopseudomonas khazarica]|uniref:hypothetical protein n=1 Tax=Ectopseudomonas khazarica TaxID=2502979 RepID=UPI001AF012D7|nr:hypothetical protein [Pseudomonas khazarica]QTS85401.1 hypothetical protein JLK41_19055 [Pseudomonas khazarica]
MNSLDKDELALLAPELKSLINDGFEKKRKKNLTAILENRIAEYTADHTESLSATLTPEELALELYRGMLNELKEHHIFQWATHYNDVVSFIFKDLCNREQAIKQSHLDSLSVLFYEHAKEICERGTEFSSRKGVEPTIIQSKALGGFLKFLLLAIQPYLRLREKASNVSEVKLTWGVCSSIVHGVVKGYATVLGWKTLLSNSGWVHALGFLKGSDAITLLNEAADAVGENHCFSTIVPMLMAFELIIDKTHDIGYLTPSLSRVVSGNPPFLEVTLTPALGVNPYEVIISCFFSENLHGRWDLERALNANPIACLACLDKDVGDWVAQHEKSVVVDVSGVMSDATHAHDTAALIVSKIEDWLTSSVKLVMQGSLTRNYAKDFPLEDPNHRQMYMVERYTVKQLLESIASKTGIHLWCSVRRSGKTTAALNFGDKSNSSLVIFQTMDNMRHQPQHTIFAERIEDALANGAPIPRDFFESLVNECQISTTYGDLDGAKRIFIIDEYESLFGKIAAMSRRDEDLRHLVCLPLLSQMVSFATRNLIVFMGQRPDAHYILSAQNQLSPLVQQLDFPLFAHQESAPDSEFVELIKRVLSQKLQFEVSFADAVYEETSGHPYLTVNLLIDLCDWLIEQRALESKIKLDRSIFELFAQQRLAAPVLRNSKYYSFFAHMLSEYLSEDARRTDPWLYCVASVLRQIVKQHPKVLQCSMIKYRQIVEEATFGLTIPRDQLLSSAVMANFLKTERGIVKPGIKLMARIAGTN